MKIQFISDLHFEFSQNVDFINSSPLKAVGEVLVLAGDTGYLNDEKLPKMKFWEWTSSNFKHVLLVPGNHEFYNYADILSEGDSWCRMIKPNVGYYQNQVIRINDIDFILSTLWTDIPLSIHKNLRRRMNDFRYILYGGRTFNTDDCIVEHKKCFSFIKQSVAESTAKHIVVVTHHLPTMEIVPQNLIWDNLDCGYATELSDFIKKSHIDIWIHGHSHSCSDTIIGNTHIVSNQVGYTFYNQHMMGFEGNRWIEII